MADYMCTEAGLYNLSEYGAIYWPWVKILNPSPAAFGNVETVTVPPSGAVAGVFSRTADARPGGVYDPPAGVEKGVLKGVLGFETDEVLQEKARDLVYPKRVNPLTTQEVGGIRLGQRVLRPGQEATALADSDRVRPDLTKVELDAKLFKGEIRLSDEVLEDNIERGELRQTLMELLAGAVRRDMEEVIINGDTASADPFLARMDGLLKQAKSNVVDAGGAKFGRDVLRDMLKAMPSEYLRDKKTLRYLSSVDSELDYRNELAERATGAGDRFLETDAPVMFSGVPVTAVPLFPESLGEGKDQTAALLCDPKNIHVGIWRNIRIETARDISEGTLRIVVTLRFDAKFIYM